MSAIKMVPTNRMRAQLEEKKDTDSRKKKTANGKIFGALNPLLENRKKSDIEVSKVPTAKHNKQRRKSEKP